MTQRPDSGPGPGPDLGLGSVQRLKAFFEHNDHMQQSADHKIHQQGAELSQTVDSLVRSHDDDKDDASAGDRSIYDVGGRKDSLVSVNSEACVYVFTLENDAQDHDNGRLDDVYVTDSSARVKSEGSVYEHTLESDDDRSEIMIYTDIIDDVYETKVSSASVKSERSVYESNDDDEDDGSIYDMYEKEKLLTSGTSQGSVYEHTLVDDEEYDEEDEECDEEDDDGDDDEIYRSFYEIDDAALPPVKNEGSAYQHTINDDGRCHDDHKSIDNIYDTPEGSTQRPNFCEDGRLDDEELYQEIPEYFSAQWKQKDLNSIFTGWTGSKIWPWTFWSRLVQYNPRVDTVPTRPTDVHTNMQALNNTTILSNIPLYSGALNKCLLYLLLIRRVLEKGFHIQEYLSLIITQLPAANHKSESCGIG